MIAGISICDCLGPVSKASMPDVADDPKPKGLALPRAKRLLDLIQLLRSHRFPVSGAVLAAALGISLRTLYRDIATLQAQGASIDGEAGLGFILRPGFMLPPLMFSEDEIEALVLGARWVADRADAQLGDAARSLLAKVSAVLPQDLRAGLDQSALLLPPGQAIASGTIDLAVLRRAIRAQRKLAISYVDGQAARSQRVIWPFALAFFDSVRVVVAWCETRADYRSFRCDRISELSVSDTRYPKRREILLHDWRERQKTGGG